MNKPCKYCENGLYFLGKSYQCSESNECDKFRKYNNHLESKRMFLQGDEIKTADELDKQTWVFMNGKIKHIKIIYNIQYGIILTWLDRGMIRYAIRKEGK
jgi:hypothetical protein